MKRLKKLCSVIIAGCLMLALMNGIAVYAEGDAADECIVADFGNAATVERIADVQTYYEKATDITYKDSASSLKITVPSWGFYLTDTDNKAMVPAKTDVSSYKYFKMRLYSENKGDSFVVMLSSDDTVDGGAANRRFVVTTQGTGWQEVSIALPDSINNGAEWNNIGGVYLKTGVNSTSTASGHEIYIDKIWFGNTAGDEIDPADKHVVADFSNATFSQQMANKKVYGPEDTTEGFTVENTTTIKPNGTAVRWNFKNNSLTPTIVNTVYDVSGYDNVRIRFYSPNKGDKFIVFAGYKDQNSVPKNPYFYYIVTSDGNGWQDLKIPKSDFIAGGARPLEDGGDNVEATWEHIGAMYMEISGNYGSTMPNSDHSIIVDSILFEKEAKVEPTPTPTEKPAKEEVIIADFGNKTTVESIANRQDYLSVSTNRTYRNAESSLKISFPDYGFYLLGSDGQAIPSPKKDVSDYKYFRMRVYSSHAGDGINIVVKTGETGSDVGGNHFRGTATTTGTGWQEIAIPLSSFEKRDSANWKDVAGVLLRTGLGGMSTTEGESLYIDKIWFADTDGSENKIDHIMSDELYIDESEATINGFGGMTVAQVRSYILLPDNVELTFYDGDTGYIVQDETIPAVSGMQVVLSNDEEYVLGAELYDYEDIKFNGATRKKFSEGLLKVELNAKCYRQGIRSNANLIVAQYSNDDRLIGIEVVSGTVEAPSSTITVDYDVKTVENTKIKVYVWDDLLAINSLAGQAIELTPETNN